MNNTLPNIKVMYNNLQNKINTKNSLSRLFICFFVLFLVSSASETFGSSVTMLTQQIIKEKRVTINLTNKPLNVILAEIQKQSKIDFGFSKNLDPSTMGLYTAVYKDKTVEEVLNALLMNTKFTYRIVANRIIIEPKKQSSNTKSSSGKINIAGRVFDKRYQPIAGATVIVVGTSNGAITDEQGSFSLNMELGQSLEASFIGYKPITEVITSAQNNLVFTLNQDNLEMDEVIVTGYQNTEKSKTVGSYTTIKAEDLNLTGVTNIADALQGQVAGMVVKRGSARAGATPKILVRGQTTILGNTDPIWVVDGIIQDDPIQLNARTGVIDDLTVVVGNQVSWLNPGDIETITVLKDASATAIYGSRASNGVIVITTKKSKTEKATISYSGSMSVKPKPNYGMFNLMNSKERIQFSEELAEIGYIVSSRGTDAYARQMNTYEGSEAMFLNGDITKEQFLANKGRLETVNTNWLDYLTRTSVGQQHNISVSDNRGKTNYRISVGYMNDKGQEINNDMKQMTFASKVGVQLHKKLRIDFSINGTMANTSAALGGSGPYKRPLNYALSTSRSIPLFNEDGSYAYYQTNTSYSNRLNNNEPVSFNILNEIENSSGVIKRNDIKVSANLTWNIKEWLKYEFVGGYSHQNSRNDTYYGEKSWTITNSYRGYDFGKYGAGSIPNSAAVMPIGGTLNSKDVFGNSYNIQNKLMFNKTINNKHFLNAMIAQEIRSVKTHNYSNTLWGYVPERGDMLVKPTPPEDLTPGESPSWKDDFGLLNAIYNGKATPVNDYTNNFMSLFATFVYTYDNKYVFNMSVRNDFSNRFGQDVNKRIDPTYSFGLKWRMGEESFIKGSKWLNYLDLSATYGIQGNATLSRSPDIILELGNVNPHYKEYSSSIVSLPNKNLSWERTTNWNFSLSTRVFNAVNITFDYYRRSSNAIVAYSIPVENGRNNMDINGGMVYNNGMEATVSFSPVVTKDFGLNLSVNASRNWNKGGKPTLDNLTLNNYISGKDGIVIKEGYPIGAVWRYSFAGLDPVTGNPMFNHMDVPNDVAFADPTSLLEYAGTKDPYFSGGVNLSIRYRRLTFGSSFNLQLGGITTLPNPFQEFGYEGTNIPDPTRNMDKDLLKRWKKPGDEKFTNYPSIQKNPLKVKVPGQNQESYGIGMWSQSDAMTINSTYLRCNNMNLTYNFDSKKLKKVGIGSLSINATVNNVFVIANKRLNGFDPELNNEVMPRTYSFGLSLSF